MVAATGRELQAAGVNHLPGVVVADPGYWHTEQMDSIVGRGMQVLVPPESRLRDGPRVGWDGGYYAFMRRVLETDYAQAIYKKRQATVEPVFGQIKHNRGIDRFQLVGVELQQVVCCCCESPLGPDGGPASSLRRSF